MARTLATVCLSLACALAGAQSAPERLRVGGDQIYPPFEWLDSDGQPRGFNVELMRLLADDAGVELEFQLGNWPDTVAALQSGELDVVPMFVSDDRRQRFRFTNVYVYQTHAFFGREDAAPVDISEYPSGWDVVVEADSFAATELARINPEVRPRLAVNTFDALRLVAIGEVEYALVAAPVAGELIDREGWEIVRRSPPLWPRGYAFAVRGDRPELARWLQLRLFESISSSQFLTLYERWSDRIEPDVRARGVLRRLVPIIVALGLILVAFLAWNFTLRRQVARRTRDVTSELEQRREAERHAQELARREPITNLYNVRYFCGKCAQLIERQPDSRSAELMLVRLVELETVVRTFGYHAAEKMLLAFSRALCQAFDQPVAHLGRGTFAVFDIAGRANARLDALHDMIRQDKVLIYPRFIAGSAFYPDDDAQIGELLQKAELALVESHARQCRWTRYHGALQSDETDLRIIESFHGDRVPGLWFALQPQIALSDRKPRAAELLARWNHPELGEIEPGRFVPLLESAGLVGKLTRAAMTSAITLLESLPADHDLRLSINASARDLSDPGFANRLAATLEQADGAADKLKLEITETGLIYDREIVLKNLCALTEQGVTISVDDFGIGYSSLDYISRFPVSEVKIDRSFIARMLDCSRDFSIVRSTIAMAHELKMVVVGEGCETEAQLGMLTELDCDLAQGWVVGYPEPAEQFIDRLGARAKRGA